MAKSPTRRTNRPIEKGAVQKGKGLIRSLTRSAVRDKKAHPGEARQGRLREPTACERCGAIFMKRSWRQDHKVTLALLDRAAWTVCPACEQAKAKMGQGRVLVRGKFALANEEAVRARIRNVAARAGFTQPSRRVVSVDREGDALEVLTTSQKLAHRIVNELKKAFRGRATFNWSDDGTLLAVWRREA
jgi:5-methylcytosine-specific restriction endonuclease McrA